MTSCWAVGALLLSYSVSERHSVSQADLFHEEGFSQEAFSQEPLCYKKRLLILTVFYFCEKSCIVVS